MSTTLYALTVEEAELLTLAKRFLDLVRGHPGPSLLRVEHVLQQVVQEIRNMSATFDSEMTQLRGDIAAQSTVIASATTAFQGLVAKLTAAEAAATSAGATADQISGVTTLRQALEANTAALAAAIPQGTPAAPAPTSTDPAPTAPTSTDPATAAASSATTPAAADTTTAAAATPPAS